MVALSVSLGLSVALLSGCNSKSSPTPENFKTGLNRYFPEHRRDCLFAAGWRFPYTTSDAAEQKKLDALVKVLVLQKVKEGQLSWYEPTKFGQAAAPRFCYGYREVTSVDSFTPLKVKDGFNQTEVSYHYGMKDVPAWAKSDDLKAVFPDLGRDLSGNATGKTTMAQTTVGWQVPE